MEIVDTYSAFRRRILVVEAARIAHEVNRAFCLSIGDNSILPWDDSPEWQKASVIKGVEFKLDNPDATPEQQHEVWMKVKREDGWTYGEEKDPEKKTHPAMLPYDQLPQEQKTKDYLFAASVLAVANMKLS